jgi:hypothetical protein
MSGVTISVDREVLFVERKFKVQVTLGYCGHISLWKTLLLELLVSEKSGPDPKDKNNDCLKCLVLKICARSSRVFQTIKTLVDNKEILIITYVIYKQQ